MTPRRRPRYAWVLAGRHRDTAGDGAIRPRAEFEVFLERNDGVLLSRSSLDDAPSRLARGLARFGSARPALARLALAWLVQAQARSFDAIIASGEDIGVPLALASLVTASDVPIHMMFHGHHLDSSRLRALAPVLRQMAHVHLHCLSEALRRRTMDVLGIPAARCHATGYGVDTNFFTPVEAGKAAVIASAGAANRDYATLAEAARVLPAEVRIAADSTWVPPASSAAPAGWPPNVAMRSYGNYAALRELYGCSGFVVVPLHPAQHACGYAVIAEAMAMGRAVIATRTAAPPDFLRDGDTGRFVEPGDPAALRHAMSGMLDDPVATAAMGRRARTLMLDRYSLPRFCARLETIIAATARPERKRITNQTLGAGAR